MAQELDDFQKRMFDASEEVYAQIVHGGGVGDVQAALMDAQLRASTDEQ